MIDFSSRRVRGVVFAAALLALGAGTAWLWSARPFAPVPEPSPSPLATVVDRGMSEEQARAFQDRIAELEAQVSANESNGARDVSVILALGNANYTVGRLGEAARWYNDILRTHPNDAPALENLGQAQAEMGDYAGAEVSWRKAADQGGYEQTYLKLADLIDEHFPERADDIRPVLEAAIANNGQTVALVARLGRWYADQGMLDEAISHYEVARQLDPDDASIVDELGRLRAERSRRAGF